MDDTQDTQNEPQVDSMEQTVPEEQETKSPGVLEISEDSVLPASSIYVQPKTEHVIPPTPPRPIKNSPSNPLTKTISSEFSNVINVIPPQKNTLQSELNPTTSPQSQNKTPGLKQIRTYESDVADVLSHTKMSAASIAIAENKKNTGSQQIGEAPKTHSILKLLIILISLTLIGGGIFGAYYFFMLSPLANSTVPVNTSPKATSLIPSDSQASIHIDGLNQKQILSLIRTETNKPMSENTIKEIIPVQTQNAITSRISALDVLTHLDINAPDMLVRTLTPSWMLGVYNNNANEKDVFVVVTTNFFQNAFAGMLAWEHVMADDLKPYLVAPSQDTTSTSATTTAQSIDPLANLDSILPQTLSASSSTASTTPKNTTTLSTTKKGATLSDVITTSSTTQNASSTSTTTEDAFTPPPSTAYITIRGNFEDRIVKNKDVREFKTSDGTVLFLYSFLDNTRLIVTGSEATLTEVLTRLEKQSFMR
ncbi:MAG: hypothetical protein WCG07_03255 [Candidatus Taylorbacteria bacterium]